MSHYIFGDGEKFYTNDFYQESARETIPDPKPLENPSGKQNIIQMILPFLGMAIMLGFFIMNSTQQGGGELNVAKMLQTGGMMIGMLVITVIGSISSVFGQGNSQALDSIRSSQAREYKILRERINKRKFENMVERENRYPSPNLISNFIGNLDDTRNPLMWQLSSTSTIDVEVEPNSANIVYSNSNDDDIKEPLYLFLNPRAGVSVSRMSPALRISSKLPVLESFDPYIITNYRNFVQSQPYLINSPATLSFRQKTFYSLSGDPNKIPGLLRSVIMNLSFIHSPNILRIGLVSNLCLSDSWDWLPWLPHTVDVDTDNLIKNDNNSYSDSENISNTLLNSRYMFDSFSSFLDFWEEESDSLLKDPLNDETGKYFIFFLDSALSDLNETDLINSETKYKNVRFVIYGNNREPFTTGNDQRYVIDKSGRLYTASDII